MRHCFAASILLISLALFAGTAMGQAAPSSAPSEMVQVGPPPMRRAEPPSVSATAAELESHADEMRSEKAFLDAIDYYRAALEKKPENMSSIYNKIGISELMLQRYKEAKKDFQRSFKADPTRADAYNNLGVVYYEEKKYGSAIRQYQKALELRQDSASYYSNLGAAHFSKKDYEKASLAYGKALELDPDIFERTSRTGVTAQLPSPEDRARYDYFMARLYAKTGDSDRSLMHLRRAMEEGYKEINNVFKEKEFASLRKDPRFTELMAAKPPGIPE